VRYLQLALVEDVNCYLRVLEARSADELMDVVVECHGRLRSVSKQLKRALE
jgi:hypothetical protein